MYTHWGVLWVVPGASQRLLRAHWAALDTPWKVLYTPWNVLGPSRCSLSRPRRFRGPLKRSFRRPGCPLSRLETSQVISQSSSVLGESSHAPLGCFRRSLSCCWCSICRFGCSLIRPGTSQVLPESSTLLEESSHAPLGCFRRSLSCCWWSLSCPRRSLGPPGCSLYRFGC